MNQTPLMFRALNWLLDDVLPPFRMLLFPFRGVTAAMEVGTRLLWLLSNEYTKRHLGYCGRGVRIYGRFHVTAPKNLYLEDNVHINENAFIRAEGGLRIGANTHISRNLVVYTMNHQYEGEYLPYDARKVLKPVYIGRNVWIGMNVTITPGVTIGDGAVIGMGTVVSADVPPLAVVGGAPQRVLKMRSERHYRELEQARRYSGMSGFPWRSADDEN